MSKKNYLIQEKGYSRNFAIVIDVDSDNLTEANENLVSRVGQAVEDFFNYEEPVKLVKESLVTNHMGTSLKFTGVDDFKEVEIREILLKEVATY